MCVCVLGPPRLRRRYDLTFQFETELELKHERSERQRDLVLYLPDAIDVVDTREQTAWRVEVGAHRPTTRRNARARAPRTRAHARTRSHARTHAHTLDDERGVCDCLRRAESGRARARAHALEWFLDIVATSHDRAEGNRSSGCKSEREGGSRTSQRRRAALVPGSLQAVFFVFRFKKTTAVDARAAHRARNRGIRDHDSREGTAAVRSRAASPWWCFVCGATHRAPLICGVCLRHRPRAPLLCGVCLRHRPRAPFLCGVSLRRHPPRRVLDHTISSTTSRGSTARRAPSTTRAACRAARRTTRTRRQRAQARRPRRSCRSARRSPTTRRATWRRESSRARRRSRATSSRSAASFYIRSASVPPFLHLRSNFPTSFERNADATATRE